ncbi:MAG: PQQ-binding-like beta-propeller repeat protein [Treponema sp.]|jgi:outer membrane protein assembly factor BamB|nr:PQQ-binding-like beta-propeller repeat protein [Treponema sp.]
MKKILFLACVCLLTACCFEAEKNTDEEPPYEAKIAWDSGLYSNDYQSHIVEDGAVYFYERPPGYHTVNVYALTKLDADTGKLLWRSREIFNNIIFCQPIVNDGIVYVFLEPNTIWCFDTGTGEKTATVKVDVDGKNLNIEKNPTVYKQYLYLSLWGASQYFTRLDINSISHNISTEAVQYPEVEILWEPETKGFVTAKPVVHDNIIYTATYTATYGAGYDPVELAGFNVETKETVFHVSFGGPEDGELLWPEKGSQLNPILIHEGVIYYLSWSIRAWKLKTGEPLFSHVFDYPLPEPQWYGAAASLQATYYKGKIFYTSGECYTTPDSFRNVHCIDAKTGKQVWSHITKNSYSLETNPIIAHGRLFVSHYWGLWVYEPETGKIIGVDKSFYGEGQGRNILYKDYMICLREDRENNEICRLVAVYVGK